MMQREAMLRIDNETELRVNEMHEMVSPASVAFPIRGVDTPRKKRKHLPFFTGDGVLEVENTRLKSVCNRC